MNYLLYFLLTGVISFALTGVMRSISFKYGILSKPRDRDIHKKPMPRLGGPAIVISFLAVTALVFAIDTHLSFGRLSFGYWDRHLWGILLGGAFIGATMLIDDISGLKAWQKFLIQTVAALIIVASGIGVDKIHLPYFGDLNLNSIYIPLFKVDGITYHFSLISDLLTLVWMVGMMNVINFVDGVDGLAGGLSGIAAFFIFLLSLRVGQPATATVSIILSGAAAGFLIWNYPPAKIFMGDSGSMFLGFLLGVLPLISGGKLATVFLVLGFPIIDGLIVAAGRLFRGKSVTAPDKTHLHHRFIEAGINPRQAIFAIYLISIAFGWVALRSGTIAKMVAGLILILIIWLIIILLKYKKRHAHDLTKKSDEL